MNGLGFNRKKRVGSGKYSMPQPQTDRHTPSVHMGVCMCSCLWRGGKGVRYPRRRRVNA